MGRGYGCLGQEVDDGGRLRALIVEDDPDDAELMAPSTPAGQLGLASMRERAELASGWSRIESGPSEGTTVSCWLPADWLQQPGAEDEGRLEP